jgi:hypothetical protein
MAAVLWIVLGLLISLSHHVRSRSAETDTAGVLWKAQRALPIATALPPALTLDDLAVNTQLADHNRTLVQALRATDPAPRAGQPDSPDSFWSRLPRSMYDGELLRDAWGTPIVLARGDDQRLGLAPARRDYCLSAGPDRNFLTREDNLFSFEQGQPPDPLPSPPELNAADPP